MDAGAYGEVIETVRLEAERHYPDHLLGVNPAAGASFLQPLDSRFDWLIVGARFLLATDANVANRLASLDYSDAEGNAWFRNFAGAVQAAGAAAQEYDFAIDSVPGQVAAGFPIVGKLPKVWIPGGWQLRITLANVQAGDQLSAIRLYVVKRETGPSS